MVASLIKNQTLFQKSVESVFWKNCKWFQGNFMTTLSKKKSHQVCKVVEKGLTVQKMQTGHAWCIATFLS